MRLSTDVTDSGQTAANDVFEKGCAFESPFTIQHVQTHLILGPLARHVKASTLVMIAASAYFLYDLVISESVFQFFRKNSFDALW